ncbi:MAG: phosphoribosyltransferase [Thermodesulfobacteriota bacterium]
MTRRQGSNIITDPGLKDKRFVFRDRADAGRKLIMLLPAFSPSDAMVLAVPAGGVPVGIVVAEQLGLPIDVAVVSKITLPWNTEAGYGAVAFDGTVRLNHAMIDHVRLGQAEVEGGKARTAEKVNQRARALRGGRPPPDLSGKTAIVVDDGLASGFTMFTAIDALKNLGAERIIVAVPTAHAGTIDAVAEKADTVYCANVRSGMRFAVAEAYEHWYDVSETEVIEMLRAHPPRLQTHS